MPEINIETARHNMVECQIRTWEVLDPRILELMARAPRERFVPAPYHNMAFADMNIPLGRGQVMMQPKVEARLLQALNIRPQDKILEIGSGSGFMTWLLANLGQQVVSVEIIPEFKLKAEERLAALGVRNVSLHEGDGARGWPRGGPFDVILLTGSVPILADAFRQSLALGGRLAAIVGQSPVMEACIITRSAMQGFLEESLFETDLPALVNAPHPDRFVF